MSGDPSGLRRNYMCNTQHLEERLNVLEDLQVRTRGDTAPQVCRSCYYVRSGDDDTCLCNTTSWTVLPVVIAELRRLINDSQEDARRATRNPPFLRPSAESV